MEFVGIGVLHILKCKKKFLIILRSLKGFNFAHLNMWDVNTPRESCCFCCQVAQTSHISHLANIPHSRALVSSKASLAVQKMQKNRDLVRISESFVDNITSLCTIIEI